MDCSVLAALSDMALGWASRARSVRQDIVQESTSEAMRRADVEYIKRGVDDFRVDVRMQGQKVTA
ncbi:hypothetical protein [Fontibacillus panacisegetis]|uniref:hypothetical protein n=1 Tax=Fontibacillus panacisegetis TaxID=670482 RepID=UPI001FDF7791|nr:hypothetical protein [Fontibacillus panacisegetis]